MNIFIEEYNKAIINAYNDVDNELYKTKTLWVLQMTLMKILKHKLPYFSRDEKGWRLNYFKYDYLSKNTAGITTN